MKNLIKPIIYILIAIFVQLIDPITIKRIEASTNTKYQEDNKKEITMIPASIEVGQTIENAISLNEFQAYEITVKADLYLHVVIEQTYGKVLLALLDADKNPSDFISYPYRNGEKHIGFITTKEGKYRFILRGRAQLNEQLKYKLTVKEMRKPEDRDRKGFFAQQLITEGDSANFNRLDTILIAVDKYKQALQIWRELSDRCKEAEALSRIGTAYLYARRYTESLEAQQQAIPIWQSLKLPAQEAEALNNIGTVYDYSGEKDKAINYYQQTIPLWQAAYNEVGESLANNNIAMIYYGKGALYQARDYLIKAIEFLQYSPDDENIATILTNLGLISDALGEKKEALTYYERSLPICERLNNPTLLAIILTNMGAMHDSLGEKQLALNRYHQALKIWKTTEFRNQEAATLNNLGVVYVFLGEFKQALDYYLQAAEAWKLVSDRTKESETLNNIGHLCDSIDQKPLALDYYFRALAIANKINDKDAQALVLSNMGVTYGSLANRYLSIEYCQQALSLRKASGDLRGEATSLFNLGLIYHSLEEKEKAFEMLTQAENKFNKVGDQDNRIEVLYRIAQIERANGKLDKAAELMKEVINKVNILRTNVDASDLRTSFFSIKQSYIDFYISLLMEQHRKNPTGGYDIAALQLSEDARAKSLIEQLAESHINIQQGVDTGLLARQSELRKLISNKANAKFRMQGQPDKESLINSLSKEIDQLKIELQQLQSEIKRLTPRYTDLVQPDPVEVAKIQGKILDKDTILLEYYLGKEESFLWVVSQTSVASYQLPKRDIIDELAIRLYNQLIERINGKYEQERGNIDETTYQQRNIAADKTVIEIATQLGNILLSPAAAIIKNKRLLMVSDGTLQFIPFEVLSYNSVTSDKPVTLINSNEVIYLPSAATQFSQTTNLVNRKPAEKDIVFFADPVFEITDDRFNHSQQSINRTEEPVNSTAKNSDDEKQPIKRLIYSPNNPNIRIPRLKNTAEEAARILELAKGQVNRLYIGFAANRAAAMNSELSQYKYIHLSTHGWLDNERPDLSGLVFSLVDEQGKSQDGFLRTQEIFNLKLPAELVVLDACQTGLGRQIKGEGLVGLTRGFMYAGAKRLVVSLWSVSEKATTELMVQFYENMFKHKMTPATALKEAKRSLSQNPEWSAPFYWAGFVFQGDPN